MRLSRALIAISFAVLLNLFAVGVAQAYEWTVNGSEFSSLKSKVTTANSSGTFELTVPKLSLTIKCTSEKGTGELAEGAASSASITFNECVVLKPEKICTVNSPEKGAGTLTAKVTTKFLVKTVGELAKSYDEVTPTMTVLFSGAECPLPTKLEMKGTTAAAVPNMQEEATKRVRKFSKAIAEEAGVTSLTLGVNQAFLIGEDTTTLTGAFENQVQVVIGMRFDPPSLAFTGTGAGNAKTATIHSLSEVNTLIIDVKGTGMFTVTANCDNHKLDANPRNPCTVTVTCNTKPTSGTFTVKWRVFSVPNPIFTTTMPMNCP